MMGVPLRLPACPPSESASSSAASGMSATLGGRPELCLVPFTRVPGRYALDPELLVDVLEVLRYPVVLT